MIHPWDPHVSRGVRTEVPQREVSHEAQIESCHLNRRLERFARGSRRDVTRRYAPVRRTRGRAADGLRYSRSGAQRRPQEVPGSRRRDAARF